MVKTKHLKRMLHSDDQHHDSGVDEVDGSAGSTSRWLAGGSHFDLIRSHHSSKKSASLYSSQDISLLSNHSESKLDLNCRLSTYNLRSHHRPVSARSIPNGIDISNNHGPIGGPITSAIIGPEGGKLEFYDNIMIVPRGAVNQRTKFELGLVWNKSLRPCFGSNHYQMTSILSCQPSGVRFYKPVTLSLPHCLEIGPVKGEQMIPVLFSSHHTDNGRPKWTRCQVLKDCFTFQKQRIEVKVQDFCYLVWAFEDGRPDVAAKKIRIVPYASPITDGEDQKIRLHIFNDVAAVREKVKEEEEEIGGERLTSYHSYVVLKNERNLQFEVTWNTLGWVLRTPDIIKIPFRELWAFDHNSCELHFNNQGQLFDFSCHITIQQADNESKVQLSFCHDIKMNSPEGTHCRALQERTRTPPVISQEETPTLSRSFAVSLPANLPDVPPPPECAIHLLSFTSTTAASRVGTRPKRRHCSLTEEPISLSPARIQSGQRQGHLIGALGQEEVDQCVDSSSNYDAKDLDMSGLISVEGLTSVKTEEAAQFGLPVPREEATTVVAHNKNNLQSFPVQATSGGNYYAVNQFFVHNMNVNVSRNVEQRNSSMHVETDSVIPFQLKMQLSVKLNDQLAYKTWMHLSKYWNLEGYDESAHIHQTNSPAFVILTLAEEKKIVKSLGDLRKAFTAIGRDDLVEAVDNYEGIDDNSAISDIE